MCAASGRAFESGDRYVGVLAQSRATGEMVRLDYGEEAWQQGARPEGVGILGTWRGVADARVDRPRMFVDYDELLEIFRSTDPAGSGDVVPDELKAGSEQERAALRLVLALILLRKRVLVQEGSKGGAMLVRARGTPRPPVGPAYEVVENIDVAPDMLGALAERVGAVLLDPGTDQAGGAKGAGA